MPPNDETVTLVETTDPRHMTLAQFEAFAWGRERVELVRGEVVRQSPSWGPRLSPLAHGRVVNALAHALTTHVSERGLGEAFFETGYVLPALPDTYRSATLSFVRPGRLRALVRLDEPCRFAPDLAALVVSPYETWSDVQERTEDLLEAGTAAVWVVNVIGRRVAIHTPGACRVLREGDVLDGAPVLPDFAMPVADVFRGVERPARLPRGA